MQKMIEYRAAGNPTVVVSLPEDVASDGDELTPDQQTLFIEAARRAGVPIDHLVAQVQQLRAKHPDVVEAARREVTLKGWARVAPGWAYDPQPDVYKEILPDGPPAIFVSIGSDVVEEFWPAR